jgi:hypothetical protein
VAGTLVTTERGNVPIETVKVGDMALTRFGYRKVIKTFDNGVQPVSEYLFGNGQSLTATDMHSIITPTGKKPIKDVTVGDEIYFLLRGGKDWKYYKATNTKRSFLRARLTDVIQTAKDRLIGNISDAPIEKAGKRRPNCFISRFGRPITGLFLMDIMSITKTMILGTMRSTISNLGQLGSIFHNIPKNTLNPTGARSTNTSTKSGPLLLSGTKARKEESGIGSMLRTALISLYRKSSFAASVLRRLYRPERHANPLSALTLVSLHGEGQRALTTKRESALCASQPLLPINTPTQKPAHALAPTKQERVYNLTVEDQHEYFANGILVSNCWDSIRYALEPLIKGGVDWKALIE